MKNFAIILPIFLLSLGIAQAVRYCCTGSYDDSNNDNGLSPNYNNVFETECPTDTNARCLSNVPSGSTLTSLSCANDVTVGSGCTTDYCNCPQGFQRSSGRTHQFGEMKKIMFPIMGVIFGVLWVLLAFLGIGKSGKRFSSDLLLTIIGLIDGIFGIFLIFIPVTTFLGLFYICIGALSIAIGRHYWGGNRGIDFYLALTVIIFLLTGGLTFVAFDYGYGRDYFNRIALYIPYCDSDMNISTDDDGGYSDRCGNYAYFVAFCVYLLFLIQPIALLAAAFKRVEHHEDTTVVVKEKHRNK